MDRRDALNKATITTTGVGTGLLDPDRGRAFIRALKDAGRLAPLLTQDVRTAATGVVDKLATGARILRAATENADDGYRVGATFSQVPYTTRKVRLPWEITEDALHENISGEGLEGTMLDEMTTQFAIDLEDLEVNGDTAAGAGADQSFLQINDGILKLITTAAVSGRNLNGASVNSGALSKDHFFDALYALPNKYRNSGNLRWIMSPNRHIGWWEGLTNRATAAGDALLLARGGAADGPLGIPILEVPAMPDGTILLSNPKNFHRVISWQVRRRRVTGDTDATLAALDKRFYVFFIKHDIIVEEFDSVVRTYGLTAP
jgi:HK97 family phage major capsid protein